MNTTAEKMLKQRDPVLVSIDVNAPEAAVSAEIRAQAYKELRYSPSRAVILNKQELEEALHKAGVRPYTDKSVRGYMRWQVRKATLRVSLKPAWIAWAICAVALAVIYRAGLITTPLIVPPIAAAMVTPIICLCERGYRWRGTMLHGYRDYVPDEALTMALRIKQHLSSAEFVVWALGRTDHRAFDPILDVTYGHETATIAVWDEPDARLTTL